MPQKFETISHEIRILLSKPQIMCEIVSNFVAFLENLNFIPISTTGGRIMPTKWYWHPRIFRPSYGPALLYTYAIYMT